MNSRTITNITRATLAIVALSLGVLRAQGLPGTWQGTLQFPSGRSLRMLITVSLDGSAMRAVLYSIDQSPQPFAGTIVLEGSTVKMSIPALQGNYEGKLSADGTTITGTWNQAGGSYPLPLARATPETAWTIPAAAAPIKPMAADADPAFEVARIKPSNPDTPVGTKAIVIRGRQLSTVATTAIDLISFAYGLHLKQVTGGPAWPDQDKFDLLAQPDTEGLPNATQWKTMVQKLLTDRFKLTFHRDLKELSVYAIVVHKNGAKLTKSEGDTSGLPSLIFRGFGNLPAKNATMGDFAKLMQTAVLDRPVIDRTGLTDRFDFTLRWTPDASQFGGAAARASSEPDDPNAPPGLFTAIQEQLGLKLDTTKARVEVIVIDRIEKPSAN
jgi:uncharacterized protein (TIGR03435 family)